MTTLELCNLGVQGSGSAPAISRATHLRTVGVVNFLQTAAGAITYVTLGIAVMPVVTATGLVDASEFNPQSATQGVRRWLWQDSVLMLGSGEQEGRRYHMHIDIKVRRVLRVDETLALTMLSTTQAGTPVVQVFTALRTLISRVA